MVSEQSQEAFCKATKNLSQSFLLEEYRVLFYNATVIVVFINTPGPLDVCLLAKILLALGTKDDRTLPAENLRAQHFSRPLRDFAQMPSGLAGST